MRLSDLGDLRLRYHVNRVFLLIKDIVNGAYPSIEFFSNEEIQTLLRGENLQDVKSPFLNFLPDMEIEQLPLMELTTTKDVYVLKRQLNILSFFTTINKMLAILSLEARRIEENEEETIAVSLY